MTIHQWIRESDNFFTFSETFVTTPNFDELENWYNSLINNSRNKVFIINHIETKAPLGMIEVSRIDWRNRYGYIGILIGDKNNRRKGYATDAIKIIVKLSFDQWGLNKLCALVTENNIPSVKLFEKLHFTKEAILRENIYLDSKYHNQFIFSLLKREYEQRIDFYSN